jgi:hypothetical protein
MKLSEESKMSFFARFRVNSATTDSAVLRPSSFRLFECACGCSALRLRSGRAPTRTYQAVVAPVALRARRGLPSFPALGALNWETMSSSIAAVGPHAHSGGLWGDF